MRKSKIINAIATFVIAFAVMMLVPAVAKAGTPNTWHQDSSTGNWYYYDETGDYVTGFQSIDDDDYYFDNNGQVINQCINIDFLDGTSKKLQIKNREIETEEDGTTFSYTTFNIIYGGVAYENPEPKFATIVNDYILTMTTVDNNLEKGVIYKIKIRIKYQDIDDEFVVEVITTGRE